MGALASGTAATVGSGAVSFLTQTEGREASINVANDRNAYLGLEPGENVDPEEGPNYVSYNDEGKFRLQFNRLNNQAFNKFCGVFNITNNGAEDLYVWAIGEDDENVDDTEAAEPGPVRFVFEEEDRQLSEGNDQSLMIGTGRVDNTTGQTGDFDPENIKIEPGESAPICVILDTNEEPLEGADDIDYEIDFVASADTDDIP